MKYLTKFLIISTVLFFVTSCIEESYDVPQYSFLHVPIDSISYDIHEGISHRAVFTIYYLKENNCQGFSHFQYDAVGNTRNVSLVLSELESTNCVWEESASEQELEFQPVEGGLYHFRFWAGKDDDGEDNFIEETIQLP